LRKQNGSLQIYDLAKTRICKTVNLQNQDLKSQPLGRGTAVLHGQNSVIQAPVLQNHDLAKLNSAKS